MTDDFDIFVGEMNALIADSSRRCEGMKKLSKEIDDGINVLEDKAGRLLNEGMKVISREHRTQAQRIDQFNKSVDQQVREDAQKEAEWAREDAIQRK